MPKSYYSIATFGTAALDASVMSEHDSDMFDAHLVHHVDFYLINQRGETARVGFSHFIQREADSTAVEDEDGEDFPDLDEAVYDHAKQIMTVTWLPPGVSSTAVPHASWFAEATATAE